MLESVKIQRRQSEVRERLSVLAAEENPGENETRELDALDTEYRTLERRLRASLIAEDSERREAGDELEKRDEREWTDMLGAFELRQIAAALDSGKELSGQTAEIIAELRSKGDFRGLPVPWQALEQRAGETVASGTPDPVQTRPIIDRLFPASVAGRMGVQALTIGQGEIEFPVTTSSVSAGWAASETGAVASPTAYATTDRPLAPDHTLGIQMKLTRKTLKQSGSALEQAVRRDMAGAIGAALDQAVFLGSGSSGEPLGLIAGASTYGVTETAIDAAASWSAFRAAIVRFMTANAAGSPDAIRLMIRPEVWSALDDSLISGTGVSEWDRLTGNVPARNIVMTANALAAPAGGPPVASTALLTTSAGGVPPAFLGLWGAVDVIRDPFTDAASGGLRLTGLATVDCTVSRPAQSEVLTGIE